MQVLILDTVHPLLLEGLRQMGFNLIEEYAASKDDLTPHLSEIYGVVLRSRLPIDKDFLAAAPKLHFIARVGAGMENIDTGAAARLGIHCFKAPEGNRDAVGEHALGMLLMMLNNLRRADAEVRNGQWRREANRGYELQGKTLGIIGYGNMGSAFAKKLQGLDVQVLAHDKYKSDLGSEVEEVTLAELQERAEVVSLHVPLSSETTHLVNDHFIEGFSRPFYLLNTARGQVVETAALVRGLRSGKVCGAGLDVLEYEKASFTGLFARQLPDDFQYLINSDKVVLSPHIAGWSHESPQKMAEVLLAKIAELKTKRS